MDPIELKSAIEAALQADAQSLLPDPILELKGMSGYRTRAFLNSICGVAPNITYFEVGSWKGSTFVSALYGNRSVRGISVDTFNDFSDVVRYQTEYGEIFTADALLQPPSYQLAKVMAGTDAAAFLRSESVYSEFLRNCKIYLPSKQYTSINADCWTVNPADLGVVDIYFYDGGHSYDEQVKAITHFASCLASISLLIVDDWNWPAVQAGTRDGLKQVSAKVLWETEVTTDGEDSVGFWNGLGVFVLQKHN